MKNVHCTRRRRPRAFTRRRDITGETARSKWLLGCVLVLLLPGGVLARYGNSSVRSPIPSATRPPSSYEGGPTQTAKPTGNAGNLVVTGNVGGARQLRAPVPYQAPSRFQAGLGSTSLDSFLRASSAQAANGSASDSSAFYSPTGTVSKMGTPRAAVSEPSGLRVADAAPQVRAGADSAELVQPQVTGPETSGAVKDWSMWEAVGSQPVARPSGNMWNALAPSPAKAPTGRQAAQQVEAAITDREDRRARADATDTAAPPLLPTEVGLPSRHTAVDTLDASGTGQLFERLGPLGEASADASPRPSWNPSAPSRDEPSQGVAPVEPSRTLVPDGLPNMNSESLSSGSHRDAFAFGDLETGIDDLRKLPAISAPSGLDRVFLPPEPEKAARQDARGSDTLPALQRVKETADRFDTPSALLPETSDAREDAIDRTRRAMGGYASSTLAGKYQNSDVTSEGRVSALPEFLGRATDDRFGAISADREDRNAATDSAGELIGDRVLRKYREQSSASAGDFEQHMQAARAYMAQSRYYRAAESFTRASVYRPGDALPHLGKSLALFAAGDYVSSSLLLARAIELNPPCAVAQVNLVDVVGGPGRFEQRLADLERCLKSNDAQQLQFLLAYVYHQIGRSHDAARAAAAAQKAMPSSLVVDILKAAVAP